MKKLTLIAFIMIAAVQLSAQTLDTNFFPKFVPYSQTPIVNYGDDIAGVPWNDPCVLKESGQYIMYCSGVEGGLNHPNDTISIYRRVSNDGYSWTLNPTTPVLEADSTTYYRGGVETPSVVFYKGEYHMYNTVYTENNAYLFKISHATSPDGLSWTVDPTPVLEPSSNYAWMDTIVAEPGVMIKEDTLYLFYAAGSSLGGFNIGLVRSTDGANFLDTTLTATHPTTIYPYADNYQGLSTPSPVLIGDTIYLFTDVAQNVFGNNWKQVALHQFKSYGDINKWYHDSTPIHTRSDFAWTNGNFGAEIFAVTPLLDGNKLRIWYSGYNLSSIDTANMANDTTYNAYFIGEELHVNSGFWGMGTSEYVFDNLTSTIEKGDIDSNIEIRFHQNNGTVQVSNSLPSSIHIYSVVGKLLYSNTFTNSLNFHLDYDGLILISVANDNLVRTKKFISPN
jgi:energy-converting hydrogenase Eha subunit F